MSTDHRLQPESGDRSLSGWIVRLAAPQAWAAVARRVSSAELVSGWSAERLRT